jgi:hypothetical protein
LIVIPVFHPSSYGVPRKACPLSIRWALYKNQSLVSALPYPDIGVSAEFDEGDPFVNTLSTVSILWPRDPTRPLHYRTKVT